MEQNKLNVCPTLHHGPYDIDLAQEGNTMQIIRRCIRFFRRLFDRRQMPRKVVKSNNLRSTLPTAGDPIKDRVEFFRK